MNPSSSSFKVQNGKTRDDFASIDPEVIHLFL